MKNELAELNNLFSKSLSEKHLAIRLLIDANYVLRTNRSRLLSPAVNVEKLLSEIEAFFHRTDLDKK